MLAAMEPFYGLEMPAVEQQSRTSCFGDRTGSGGPAKDDQPESGSLLPARRAAPWIRLPSASRVMCSSACKDLAPESTCIASTGGIRPRNSPVLGSFALQTSPRSCQPELIELTIDLTAENRWKVAVGGAIDACPITSAWINRGEMVISERARSPVGETDTAEDASES